MQSKKAQRLRQMNEEFIGLNGEEGVDGCARVRAHECVDHMCVSP